MLVVEAATRTQLTAHFADGLVAVACLTHGGTANGSLTSPREGDFEFFQLPRLRAIDGVHGYGCAPAKKPPM